MSVWKKVCESAGGAADACVHCNDAANVAALAADSALLQSVVCACITHLNASSESVSAKAKQSSLALLCMLARNDDARDRIFDSLTSLSGALEELLGQKEQARKEFGTQLGPFHTLVLTLLLRVQRYQLNAPDVMELVHGDVALAVEVVGCVCAQQPLEHAAVAACCRVMFQMTTPSAHFTSTGGSDEPTEHALSAFSAVMLQLQRLFLVSDGVLKRVAGDPSPSPLPPPSTPRAPSNTPLQLHSPAPSCPAAQRSARRLCRTPPPPSSPSSLPSKTCTISALVPAASSCGSTCLWLPK